MKSNQATLNIEPAAVVREFGNTFRPLCEAMSFIHADNTNAVLMAAGLGGKMNSAEDIIQAWNGLLMPLFKKLARTGTDDNDAWFLRNYVPYPYFRLVKTYRELKDTDVLPENLLPFLEICAVKTWCEKILLPDREPDRIRLYLTAHDADFDDVHQCGQSVIIPISNGDWKHSHQWLDELMGRIEYKLQDETVTEEDGSDCYSADHKYIKKQI